ncbi:MAG: ribosome maturation factor RimM [Bacillota bacterium]
MELVEIGKIHNTHGLRGEVKIIPYSGVPAQFRNYKQIVIRSQNEDMFFEVKSVKTIRNSAVISLVGILNIETAEKFKGLSVFTLIESLPELETDSYYVKDLINCYVYDETIGKLGIIRDVISTGSNDVYILAREEKRDLLIPALKSTVKKVDISNKKIDVVLPQGLFEIYE